MLKVTNIVTNISKLSPAHFVSIIRHQHRCHQSDPKKRQNLIVIENFGKSYFLESVAVLGKLAELWLIFWYWEDNSELDLV